MYEDFPSNDSEEEEDEEDSEDVEDIDLDPLADSMNAYKPIKLNRSRSFDVLDRQDLSAESNKLINDVIDVLGISHPAASTLLRYMK